MAFSNREQEKRNESLLDHSFCLLGSTFQLHVSSVPFQFANLLEYDESKILAGTPNCICDVSQLTSIETHREGTIQYIV